MANGIGRKILVSLGIGLIGTIALLWIGAAVNRANLTSPYIVYAEHKRTARDVVFEAYGLTNSESDLMIIDINSRRTINLTANGKNKRPTISQDGKIYYSAGEIDSESIWVIDLIKKDNRQLLPGSTYCTNPACSRSGRYLVFEGNPKGARDILKCRTDGSEVKILTRSVILCGSPDWSPDDRKIIYDCRVTQSSGFFFGLWMMDSSGGNAHQVLSEDRVNYQRPAWSPKNNWIAFQSDKASNKFNSCGIFAIKVSASGKVEKMVNVAVDGYDNRNPRWSPNGKYIIYQSYRVTPLPDGSIASDFDLLAVDFDENMVHPPVAITAMNSGEFDPCWLPIFKDKRLNDNLLEYLSDGIKLIDSVFVRQTGI
jgi:Tol biopolymer transport system component